MIRHFIHGDAISYMRRRRRTWDVLKPNRDWEGLSRRGKERKAAREGTEAEAAGGLRWREAVLG